MPARRILILAAALLLSACTPLIDEASSPTSAVPSGPAPTSAPPQPLELEIGEFDPEGDFKVIDPCTEIPEEVYAAAGLEQMMDGPYYDRQLSAKCSFNAEHVNSNGLFIMTGDRVPKSRVIELEYLLEPPVQSDLDGVYFHHMGIDNSTACSAVIHTTRGRLVVNYGESLTDTTQLANCGTALEHLERIIHYLGENNGNAHRS
ncbi:hypothetical protein CATRI_09405 [Corynebacterium atrinae]|uniref:DUF3558 domain-containing protein n=1 Tax=Corynebacterium atrinae TaxID=1336740 RepID=UPI0025B286B0|nr:DUF3558 domain-containing protein [Corynebacterium atrinae]WJY63949.1 hypothetical protein CATRI_09405 [Corynebacterium atrinae]